MSSTSFSLTKLPVEVQFCILDYFSLRDLVRCVLVNRAYHVLCTPRIWRAVKITHQAAFCMFQSPIVEKALIRSAPLVQELCTDYDKVIKWIVRPPVSSLTADSPTSGTRPTNCICKNLVRLRVKAVDQNLVIPLIKSNPRLRTLIWNAFGAIPDRFLLEAPAYLPALEEIELDASIHPIHPQALKRFLEDLPETVRTISLHITVSRQLTAPSTDLIKCRPHPRLESIKIKGNMAGEDEYVFARFLGSCSTRLRRVVLPHHAQLWISSLFDILERLEAVPDTFCQTIPLEGTAGEELTDIDFSHVISRSSKWKRIDIRGQREVGSWTAAAIASHCQELETFTLSDCPKVNGAAVQRILCSAPNLLHVDIVGMRKPAYGPLQLHASDVVSSSWACKSLETLSVNIIGVPRPDVTVQHYGRPTSGALHSGTVEDSHDIQRRILAQIGMLTGLQELHFGHNELSMEDRSRFEHDPANGIAVFEDDQFQLTCLELSLASGLDQLVGLKELQVLNVTRMAHRLGVSELEWMQENWPCLERLEGLFNECYDILEPGVWSWLKKHKPHWGEMYTNSDEDDFFFNETRTRGGCYLNSNSRRY